MRNLLAKCLFAACAVAASVAWATVDAEMEGMEAVVRDDGTFLVGSPTYSFDRKLGSIGLHSESELWTPQKIRYRLLFNRMSVLPSWEPLAPSVWMKTGNELGDMIYQDLITAEDRPDNRTPILEGGFRTPSFKGFWVTARGFQDDHYSTGTSSFRKKMVKDEFSLIGENYPLFSSGYAGVGYDNEFVNASILAGEEYVWLFSKSYRWIPVHYAPRVDARASVGDLSLSLGYEAAYYQDKTRHEKGNRIEINGSVFYENDDVYEQMNFVLLAGLSFRALDDSGNVYTELDENRVVWPFVGFGVRPVKNVSVEASVGVNDEDWLVQDSVEFSPSVPSKMGITLGVKNISGTRLNPIADDKEYFGDSTISLSADGQMNMVQGYAEFADSADFLGFGGRASFWAEHGAETFEVSKTKKSGGAIYRYGDVSRIDSWIKAVSGELWIGAWYKEMFNFKALAGFERIDGPSKRFEVNPSEFFVAFNVDWFLFKSVRIAHSIRYRSDAEWNLYESDPMVVKGDWYWDATFEQQFPKQKLYLTGSLLHVLADEVVQTPNGGTDRLRFVCTLKKMF